MALLPGTLDGAVRSVHLRWIPQLSLAIDLRFDALSVVMVAVISLLGTLVLLYSARYFPDRGRRSGEVCGVVDRLHAAR